MNKNIFFQSSLELSGENMNYNWHGSFGCRTYQKHYLHVLYLLYDDYTSKQCLISSQNGKL